MRGRKRETESFSNMHSVYATPHELKPINSKMTKPPTKCYTKLPKRLSFGHVVQLVISLCYLSFQLQSHSKSHLQLWHHAHDDFFFLSLHFSIAYNSSVFTEHCLRLWHKPTRTLPLLPLMMLFKCCLYLSPCENYLNKLST